MKGRTLGEFVLLDLLGQGGGGQVYRAQQLALGREAVVKVMHSSTGSTVSAERFLREARLASQLDHPFAAHVYGFGTEPDGTLWIAMELVRGTALDAIIKTQGPVPLARFVPLFERLCEVVQAAHDQGIVHRDIKPANVMVISRAGRLMPKLLDLGIARRGEAAAQQLLPIMRSELASSSSSMIATASESTTDTLASRLLESETFDLTQVGAVIGTPLFMAPEQWRDASTVGAAADLYSLSLLAYQALTGAVPYEAKSLRQLAKAHAVSPLLPLPEGMPAALYGVLSKGSAKNPSDRYGGAVELGAAVRAASGIGVEPFVLPQIEDGLRENVLSEAPQPIAEALVLLEGARTPRHQLEAVMMVRRVVARYLATLALACRARIGAGTPNDAPAVTALVRTMALQGLTDDEWLALARELSRPFALRPAAHPLSELVTFFFTGESPPQVGAGERAFAALDAIALPATEAADDAVQAVLLRLVPALGTLLQALAFAFDYALVVSRDAAERWMGTRRTHRLVHSVTEPLPAGVPVLVDAVGLPVLTLWPLLQLFVPATGLPEELFFLSGAGRHGARLVALPGTFERQSEEVWPWFSEHIFDVTDAQAVATRNEKPPYKGLSTFTADDADNYFGREREAEHFANRMRLAPLLAVVGPSGSGKSSFVLAGVLPLLPKGWRAIVTRPGPAPFQALAARLGAAGLQLDQISSRSVVAALGDGESLLIVVDQFEELVTLCPDPIVREQFAGLLVDLGESSAGRVRVVLTLRDDFLIQVQQLQPLRERLSSALQLLGTPAKEELLRVLTEPARRVGYRFDDEGLPLKMVNQVAEYPGALALLSFTASQLWELRDRHLHQMRAKTYETLGGVGGALAHHAETTLAQLSPEEAELVREAFRHLVTSQNTRAVLSRREMLDLLGHSPAAHSVLEKLVVARLLVTSEDPSGDDRIEIIHEALIVSWPRLVGWLREEAETARLRDALRASTKQWADRGRPSGLLWRKETLAEYRLWRTRYKGRLTQLEEAFALASQGEETRSHRIRRSLAVAAFVILVVSLVFVINSLRKANERLVELRMEQARQALFRQKPQEALAFIEASGDRAYSAADAHVLAFAQRQAPRPDREWARKAGPSQLVAFGDGRRVLSWAKNGSFVFDVQDGTSVSLGDDLVTLVGDELWSLSSGRLARVQQPDGGLREEPLPVEANRIEAGAGWVALRTFDQTVCAARWGTQWLTASLAKPSYVMTARCGQLGKPACVCFAGPNPAGDRSMRGALVFDGSTSHWLVPDQVARSVVFVGGAVCVSTQDTKISCFDGAGAPRWSSAASGAVFRLLVSPNAERLLATSDRAVDVFDAATGHLVWAHRFSDEEGVAAAEWASDDEVLIGRIDGWVELRSAQTGGLDGHRWSHLEGVSAVTAVGQGYVSAGGDGRVRAWRGPPHLGEVVGHGVIGVWAWPWSPEVVVARKDGWGVTDSAGAPVRNLRSEALSKPLAAGMSRDRSTIALGVGRTLHILRAGGERSVELGAAVQEIWLSDSGAWVGACLDDESAVWFASDGSSSVVRIAGTQPQLSRGFFSIDERSVVITGTSGALLEYAIDGRLLREVPAHTSFASIHDLRDPEAFATSGYDGALIRWQRRTLTVESRVSGSPDETTVGVEWGDGVVVAYGAGTKWRAYDPVRDLDLTSEALPREMPFIALPDSSSMGLAADEEGTLWRIERRLGAPTSGQFGPLVHKETKMTLRAHPKTP